MFVSRDCKLNRDLWFSPISIDPKSRSYVTKKNILLLFSALTSFQGIRFCFFSHMMLHFRFHFEREKRGHLCCYLISSSTSSRKLRWFSESFSPFLLKCTLHRVSGFLFLVSLSEPFSVATLATLWQLKARHGGSKWINQLRQSSWKDVIVLYIKQLYDIIIPCIAVSICKLHHYTAKKLSLVIFTQLLSYEVTIPEVADLT